MKAYLIYDSMEGKFHLPEGFTVLDHQLQSNCVGDNLVEFAGRVCYDSLGQPNTRNSKDYHNHINDVGHGSVQEHFTLNFELPLSLENLAIFIDRPGCYVTINSLRKTFVLTMNLRAFLEWEKFPVNPAYANQSDELFYTIGSHFINRAGLATDQIFHRKLKENHPTNLFFKNYQIVQPFTRSPSPKHRWLSYYITDVSRNLSHELVRHKYETAVSQRSTRYVDESESIIAWHPLILENQNLLNDIIHTSEKDGKSSYTRTFEILQESLLKQGASKFDAKKQARGAARGLLPSALSTSLVFSASVAQWNRIIAARKNPAADLEIHKLMDCIIGQSNGVLNPNV